MSHRMSKTNKRVNRHLSHATASAFHSTYVLCIYMRHELVTKSVCPLALALACSLSLHSAVLSLRRPTLCRKSGASTRKKTTLPFYSSCVGCCCRTAMISSSEERGCVNSFGRDENPAQILNTGFYYRFTRTCVGPFCDGTG